MRALPLAAAAVLVAGTASADITAPASAPAPKRIFRIARARLVVLSPIPFASKRADFGDDALRLLDGTAEEMRGFCDCHRPSRVVIVGDALPREKQPGLAQSRAQAVVDALVERGLDRSLFEVAVSPSGRHRRQVQFEMRWEPAPS